MALTKPYISSQYGGVSGPSPERLFFPIADNVIIYEGALVQVNASGLATPAGIATTADTHLYHTVGRAQQTYDNTVAGHAASAFTVEVAQGAFEWDNSVGDPVAQADVMTTVYAENDSIIAKTSATSTLAKAGIFVGFSNDFTARPIVITVAS